ncbi:MAG: hypothetical protein A2Y34_16385 [Spirochaetes bacterium GWC1_27_15]|nr:MAG: hypothetical protein A2Z98_09345 [Spirochaetes bacterium GWB1_27_13]OHD24370.1 MAG: hypothetical protein A2Y34_16385 [Spirochaetes bacterium GWC1_27_15]
MKYDSLIFDLDGTLWDATPTVAMGWTNGLKDCGENIEVKADILKQVVGKPFKECLEYIFPNITIKYPKVMELIDYHTKNGLELTGGILYDFLIEGIKKLSNHYKLYIVSNCEDWYLDIFFRLSGLKEHFLDYDCYGLSKKDKSEMLINIVNKNTLKSPIYIGDTEGDMKSAENAQVPFCFASYGFGKVSKYSYKINSFKELVSLLTD